MATSTAHVPPLPNVRTWPLRHWPVTLWLTAAVITNAVSIRLAPETFRRSMRLADFPEGDRPVVRHALARLHLSTAHLAWFSIVTGVVATAITLAIAWLLIRHSPRSAFTSYLAFVLLGFNNAYYPPGISDVLPGQPVAQSIIRAATVVGVSGFFTLPFVFPTGRFVPRWTALLAAYAVVDVFFFAFMPSINWEAELGVPAELGMPIEALTTGLFVLIILGSVFYRYRKVSTPDQRRQTKWVAFGLIVGVPGFFLGDALMRNISATPAGIACMLGFLLVMPVVTVVPIIAIGIAILHHRLFDIDVILNRTLVWLVMSLAVTGTYIGVVIGFGSLIGSRSNLLLSLTTTGLVAVAFQPLRLRVERLANRLLFGDRDDPYAVLARLGHHIEDTLSSAELLPQIVRTTAEALRLPYAALFLDSGNGSQLVAASGVASDSTLRLPLIYQGQNVGALEVATRAPGEVFGQADRRLLEDLARQIGVAARTVSLANDLQTSRERIVTAREEERRRLRRDLHDGLGAQLAGLIMQTSGARSLLRSDIAAADQELVNLREELRAAVADVRRLVLGLRPPALDELGLTGALRTRLARLDRGGLDAEAPALRVQFDVHEPLPPLSAAAEVAAFRIVEEAVTNVVKHAQAQTVLVTIEPDAHSLLITVLDDGTGIAIPAPETLGIGLHSINDRATELGGTCSIYAGPEGQGTLVRVTLPTAAGMGESG